MSIFWNIYPNPELNTFSFNSPKGMCPECKGLGIQYKVNEKNTPDENLSILQGGIAPLGVKKNNQYEQIETIAKCYNFDLNDPLKSIPEKAKNIILNGSIEKFEIPSKSLGITRTYKIDFEGLKNYIKNAVDEAAITSIKRWAGDYMDSCICQKCLGSRLKGIT